MKKLFVLTTILGATFITSSAYSQVYIRAHVRVPGVRVFVSTPPPPTVVYQQYPAPAPDPVYQEDYQDGYAPAPATVVYENDFPGYAYYNYPSWNGHFRDRVYYKHYRPSFERDYRPYFNRGRFDQGRFERDHGRTESSRGRFENSHGRSESGHGRFERGSTRNVRGGYDHGRRH